MSFKERFKEKMNDRTYEEHLMKNYIKKRERAEERTNSYSYFLAAVCVLCAVLFWILGEFWLGMMLVGIGGLLVLLVYLSKKEDAKDNDKTNKK